MDRGVERACTLAAAVWLAACGGASSNASSTTPPASLPAVTIPLDIASGSQEGAVAPAPPAEPAEKTPPQYAPDPEPLRATEQYELSFRYARGEVTLAGATKRTFAQPVSTARRLGRFAVELWVGHELVERVRFDFPLLAAPPRAAKDESAASLEAGLTVTEKVLLPAEQRATRAVLVDRATGEQRELPWPPGASAAAGSALPVPVGAPEQTSPEQGEPKAP